MFSKIVIAANVESPSHLAPFNTEFTWSAALNGYVKLNCSKEARIIRVKNVL